MQDYEDLFFTYVMKVQKLDSRLIPKDVDVPNDMGLNRSLRRGSTSAARSRNVSETDIDLMNRWRKIENAKGMKPAHKMRDHYSDVRLMAPAYLRYSQFL